MELFYAFVTAGRGGKFPNFFGCSGLEFAFVSSCFAGTGLANDFCSTGGSLFFYWLVDFTLIIFFSLENPEVVFEGYFFCCYFCYFLGKAGFETDVVFGLFSKDFDY